MAHVVTREEHPLFAILLHWVHLVSFFVLIVTGLFISGHMAGVSMQLVRQVHFVFMFVFVLTTISRIYFAFVGRTAAAGSTRLERDFHHFAIRGRDVRTLGQWIGYYLFLRKTRPYTEKYNPLQKMTYTLLFPLGTLLMAVTGFALFTPTSGAMSWFTDLLGNLNTVRLWHYWGMWVLIVFFMIHFYLVLVEDLPQLRAMLLRSPAKDESRGAAM